MAEQSTQTEAPGTTRERVSMMDSTIEIPDHVLEITVIDLPNSQNIISANEGKKNMVHVDKVTTVATGTTVDRPHFVLRFSNPPAGGRSYFKIGSAEDSDVVLPGNVLPTQCTVSLENEEDVVFHDFSTESIDVYVIGTLDLQPRKTQWTEPRPGCPSKFILLEGHAIVLDLKNGYCFRLCVPVMDPHGEEWCNRMDGFLAGKAPFDIRALCPDMKEPSESERWEDFAHGIYGPQEVIGEGGNGRVQAFYRFDNKTLYAVKLPRPRKDHRQGTVDLEVKLARILLHPNILEFYPPVVIGRPEPRTLVCMEIIPFGGGLDDLGRLYNRIPPSPWHLNEVVRQISSALVYLHNDKKMVHCDIKPSNILIKSDDPFHVVLVDFGLVRPIGDNITGICGTRGFAAPEQASTTWNSKVDVWSLGAVALDLGWGTIDLLNTGEGYDGREQGLMNDTQDIRSRVDDIMEEGAGPIEFLEFISQMLQADPTFRIDSRACLEEATKLAATLPANVSCTPPEN